MYQVTVNGKVVREFDTVDEAQACQEYLVFTLGLDAEVN